MTDALVARFKREVRIQDEMENDQLKGSIGDLIRLIQLRNELAGDRPLDITARWVD